MKTLLLGAAFVMAIGATTGCSSERTVVRKESVTAVPAATTTVRTTTVTDPTVVEHRTTERTTRDEYDVR